jgi:hypothetical protein
MAWCAAASADVADVKAARAFFRFTLIACAAALPLGGAVVGVAGGGTVTGSGGGSLALSSPSPEPGSVPDGGAVVDVVDTCGLDVDVVDVDVEVVDVEAVADVVEVVVVPCVAATAVGPTAKQAAMTAEIRTRRFPMRMTPLGHRHDSLRA